MTMGSGKDYEEIDSGFATVACYQLGILRLLVLARSSTFFVLKIIHENP